MEVASVASLAIHIVVLSDRVGREYWGAHKREFADNIRTFGFLQAVILLILPGVGRTIYRVKYHLLGRENSHALTFKDSFTESFAMIGVAGAIIAQIAITGLSLDRLDETHWTAYGAFVISVIAGCMSVYYSCTMQLLLSGLHGPKEILEWLTAPIIARPQHTLLGDMCFPVWFGFEPGFIISRFVPAVRERMKELPEPRSVKSMLRWIASVVRLALRPEMSTETNDLETNDCEGPKHRKPSISAALLLMAPSQLLTLSLGAFLTGQGIYLGTLYGSRVELIKGTHSALKIMITYIVVTSVCLLLYGVYLAVKTSEDWFDRRSKDQTDSFELQEPTQTTAHPQEVPDATQAVQGGATHQTESRCQPSTIDADTHTQRLADALEASTRAQVEQLEAQRTLLQALRTNGRAGGQDAVLG